MKKFLLTLLLLTGLGSNVVYSQDTIDWSAVDWSELMKDTIDPLHLWQYQFTSTADSSDKLVTLLLRRTEEIKNEKKSITPEITFDIYPVALADSIYNFESGRTMQLSYCSPRCGETIVQSTNFFFWSDPWSIICAFRCSEMDYTRANAWLIMEEKKTMPPLKS